MPLSLQFHTNRKLKHLEESPLITLLIKLSNRYDMGNRHNPTRKREIFT